MARDPEVLDPAPSTDVKASADVLSMAERAFAGSVLKTQGGHIEIAGPAGTLSIVQTPMAAILTFRAMRIPVPPDAQAAAQMLRRLARGDLLLMEERGAGALRRTHLVRVLDGKLFSLEDTTVDREPIGADAPIGADGTIGADGPIGADEVRVVRFGEAPRAATPAEITFLHDATGGTFGRLKRKLMEKLLEKTLGAVSDAMGSAIGAAAAAQAPPADDGSRKLGKGGDR